MARILLVEDEPALAATLRDILIDEGHRFMVESRGAAGLERALREKPSLVLLDVMLPEIDGFTLCRELRQRGLDCPVLMLTAKGRVDDRVRGLDAGADDYLVKPFSTKELLARVRALLRRSERTKKGSSFVLEMDAVRIDFVRREASRAGEPLDLSAREYEMLRLLAERVGEPVTRAEFLDRVWEYHSFPTTRTVDNHIAKLRAKIEPTPENPRWITTVHGTGYRLEKIAAVDSSGPRTFTET